VLTANLINFGESLKVLSVKATNSVESKIAKWIAFESNFVQLMVLDLS
jgi:hypothetical protein